MLFNLCRALEEDSTGAVVLVEGFLDCMKVSQAEYSCVALMDVPSQERKRLEQAQFDETRDLGRKRFP